MAFQKGDVVLIPFPFTDLSATKTRPAIVVSSNLYHSARSEILIAYVSSQLSSANNSLDHVLQDWRAAGLLKPSFVRPKVAAVEPKLVVHQIGQLAAHDLRELDRRLRQAMALTTTAIEDIVNQVDFLKQSPTIVQALAEKSVKALQVFSQEGVADIAKVKALLDA